jgi:hypothetical protein
MTILRLAGRRHVELFVSATLRSCYAADGRYSLYRRSSYTTHHALGIAPLAAWEAELKRGLVPALPADARQFRIFRRFVFLYLISANYRAQSTAFCSKLTVCARVCLLTCR